MKAAPEVKKVNRAFLKMSAAIRDFRHTCFINGSPIRGVSYRVLHDGQVATTKLRVTYRRKP